MDLSIFPNEIICDIYQYLNPNDQLNLAATSRSIRECFPNWKQEHQKLFINCMNKINEIKYNIINWKEYEYQTPDAYPTACKYHSDNAFDFIIEIYSSSQLLIGEKLIYYQWFGLSYYEIDFDGDLILFFNDTLYTHKGHVDNYNANKNIQNNHDLIKDKNLTMRTYEYRRLIKN